MCRQSAKELAAILVMLLGRSGGEDLGEVRSGSASGRFTAAACVDQSVPIGDLPPAGFEESIASIVSHRCCILEVKGPLLLCFTPFMEDLPREGCTKNGIEGVVAKLASCFQGWWVHIFFA